MASASDEGSITLCLGLLKQGDPQAAQAIWDRYFQRFVALRAPGSIPSDGAPPTRKTWS